MLWFSNLQQILLVYYYYMYPQIRQVHGEVAIALVYTIYMLGQKSIKIQKTLQKEYAYIYSSAAKVRVTSWSSCGIIYPR